MRDKIKVFISHSTKDEKYANAIVEFLKKIGVPSEAIFCSSIEQHGVELGKNFIDKIYEQFREYELEMLFLLSKNFYNSPVSLNEMGASWVKGFHCFAFLIHGFPVSDINGVIDSHNIALIMDDKKETLQYRLDEFGAYICEIYNLEKPENWIEIRDDFIDELDKIKKPRIKPAVIMKSPI